jgi:hypothetical protein
MGFLTSLIGPAIGAIGGGSGKKGGGSSGGGGPTINQANAGQQSLAQKHRYAQLGIPNSTAATQDEFAPFFAASVADQSQLMQLAMQANQGNAYNQGASAPIDGGNTSTSPNLFGPDTGNLSSTPGSGTV